MWRRAWVNTVDKFEPRWPETFRLVQNHGTGLLIQGGRDWVDYQVSADITPHLVIASGIAARVQGLKRYYALLLKHPGELVLIKVMDHEKILAKTEFEWQFGITYQMDLAVNGNRIRAIVDQQPVFDLVDHDEPLTAGGIALVCREGRTATQKITISPSIYQ